MRTVCDILYKMLLASSPQVLLKLVLNVVSLIPLGFIAALERKKNQFLMVIELVETFLLMQIFPFPLN